MASARVLASLATLVAMGVVGAVVVASGALAEREDARIPTVAIGAPIATSRADVVVEGIEPAEEGGIAVTLAVDSRVPVSMQVRQVVTLVDDRGELASAGQVMAGDVAASAAQPGVADVFTILYEPERDAVGSVRVEVVDARWVPRDETAFGLAPNFYDERVVAIVEMP